VVPLLDLTGQYETIRDELDGAIRRVVASQRFILGEEVEALEREVASYLGVSHAVGVASGTDALLLTLRALGIGDGDEVLLPTFTFFATAGAVVNAGARPVFADIEPQSFGLDADSVAARVTPRTRALIAVHLFGQCADLEPLRAVAEQHQLVLIEDSAQAIGAELDGRKAGALSAAGCFSFFPTKNLGGFGDGGLVSTTDESLAQRLRMLRVHGAPQGEYRHAVVGYNSRLDALQAAVLRAKLPHLDGWNDARRRNARRYRDVFKAAGLCGDEPDAPVRLPVERPGRKHVYHQFVIRARHRDELRRFLGERSIGTGVYYPVSLHQQECFRSMVPEGMSLPRAETACKEVLALPIYPELTKADQEKVVAAIADFCRAGGSHGE
jgi:dTDP-4-amino-4,6-dideoxygalactose transaminase